MTPLTGLRRLRGVGGAVACVAGVALLCFPPLLTAVLGVEAIATGFWLWAREADDAADQLPRWTWLRRPAAAMWLALAVHAVAPGLTHPMAPGAGIPEPVLWLDAIAVLWAGLELVAALPLARGYSDLPGPYPPARAFIPLVLPAAGFLLLWRQAPHWTEFEFVRHAALVLLVFTAFLCALRAFARRGWTASLRWLAVSQSALSAALLTAWLPGPTATLVLWIASFGSMAILLAGEMAGASTRRGATGVRLWRAAGGFACAAVAWPAMIAITTLENPGLRIGGYVLGAVAIALSTWLLVARLETAPERRLLVRPGPGGRLIRAGAIAVLAGAACGLALAWWNGFEPPWTASALALAPAAAGALIAYARKEHHVPRLARIARRGAERVRPLASTTFVLIMRAERGLVGGITRVAGFAISPVRDLHMGDAQEYLLFLIGIGVLGLLLPLLR